MRTLNDSKLRRTAMIAGALYALLGVVLLFWLPGKLLEQVGPQPIAYSELLDLVRADRVERAELRSKQIVVALKQSEGKAPLGGSKLLTAERLPGIDETSLLAELEKHHVAFAGKIEGTSLAEYAFGWGLPLALLAAPWIVGLVTSRWLGRGAGPLSFGRNQAKIHDATAQQRVTFADVAGVDEAKAELAEIVDYLKSPQKYRALGARIPRGVILVGPPGTGKTLLAKAVAGEAGVPFFSLSGSSFVEMFVGVGAARVRDLFEQAKAHAPCIVFIDEIDAVGRSRSGSFAVAHEEREQTLDQLLVEMDGFDPASGVLLIAATNRPEVLDRALLRPGRFDRQVVVDRPDLRGREQILRVHTRKVVLGPDVDLSTVARMTPGASGADLANVVNEAALAAARRSAASISQRDFAAAVDRMHLGLERRTLMTDDERRRVAVHEAGHALVALSLPDADPVHRVTIIPRSVGALGATVQLPSEERRLATRSELEARLAVLLAGRAAEVLLLGEPSTGAADDLERATSIAREMICRFGMSEALGPLVLSRGPELPHSISELRAAAPSSERTADVVDEELRATLERSERRARAILDARRDALEAIVRALIDEETLDRSKLDALIRASRPEDGRAVPCAA
jgi:cell division protease FtsH